MMYINSDSTHIVRLLTSCDFRTERHLLNETRKARKKMREGNLDLAEFRGEMQGRALFHGLRVLAEEVDENVEADECHRRVRRHCVRIAGSGRASRGFVRLDGRARAGSCIDETKRAAAREQSRDGTVRGESGRTEV